MAERDSTVTVLVASLAVDSGRLMDLELLLSKGERQRGASIRVERVRRRFIATRGIVREALGGALGVEPAAVQLAAGPRGKPFIVSPPATPPLAFNVSHSEDRLLIAMARDQALGVDVEVLRKDTDVAGIASRFFSPRETETLLALDASRRLEAFFACWTRKEAYIKARGEGMGIPLDRFDVAFAPGERAALLADRGDPEAVREWPLFDISGAVGAPAAIAVHAPDGTAPAIDVRPYCPA